MAVDVGTMLVTLGLDSANYTRGLAQAGTQARGFAATTSQMSSTVKGAIVGMLGAFSVGSITQMISKGLDYASALGEQAQQLGVTTRSLQEYRYAATQVGLSQEEMDGALAKLTRTLGTSPEKFDALGISIRDANGHIRDAGDIMPELADALTRMEDPATRAATLVDIFGRSGQKLAPLLAEGAAGVNNLRDAARSMGIVLSSDQIQQADAAADKLTALKTVLDARIAGTVADNATAILQLADALGKVADFALRAVSAYARFRQTTAGRIFEGSQRLLNPVALTYSLATDYNPATIGQNAGRRISGRTAAAAAIGSSLGGGVARARPGAVAAPQRLNPLPAWAARGTRNFTDDETHIFESVYSYAERIPAAAVEARGAVRMLAADLVSAAEGTQPLIDRLFPVQAQIRQYQADQAMLTAALSAGELTTTEYARAVAALRAEFGTLGEGLPDWRGLLGQLGDGMEMASIDTDAIAADLLRSWGFTADTLEATNVRIVESFADGAQGALRGIDTLARGIKSGSVLDSISGLLAALDSIGGLTNGGKGFNLFGLHFGGARAKGGPVIGGRTYLVGENGPELFTAGATGAVTPNSALRGAAGGGGLTINVNAQGAVLTETVRQWVADGVEIATARGAEGGAQLGNARLQRRMGRVPA